MYEMKRLFLTILIVLLFTASINSQSDTIKKTDIVIYTNNASCIIKREINVNDLSPNTQSARLNSFFIGNINRITFLDKDSLVVRKGRSRLYGFNINDIHEVSVESGSNGLLGFFLGFLTGGLIGYAIAPEDHSAGSIGMPDRNVFGFALLGGVVFGAVGAILGSSISDYESLNVLDIPYKDKKSKLIKFLKQNK